MVKLLNNNGNSVLTQIMGLNVSDELLNKDNPKNADKNADRMFAVRCTDVVSIKKLSS